MSAKDFSEVINTDDNELDQLLEDLNIESSYLENALTQNVTSTEYTSPKEEYFRVPKGAKEIKFDAIKPSKMKKPLFSMALALILLNELTDLNSFLEIKYFTLSVLLVALTSGCIKKEKYYTEVEYSEDKEKLAENKDTIKKVIGYIPNAKNFIALSIINFIRFNHHYPKEKENLIRKGFLGLPENEINDFLDSNGKSLKLFFSYPFQASKLVSEYGFFYKYINTGLKNDNKDASDKTFLAFQFIQDYTCNDTIITLRNEPTTNGFLILDLLFVLINYLNSHNLLGFIVDKNGVKNLLEKRKFLKTHPFQYHPSRYFNQIKFEKDEYNNFISEFQEEIKKIGNFIYMFCMEEGGTLAEAKSPIKYQYAELGEYSDLFEIYKLIKDEKSLLNDETKNKLKNVIRPKIKIPDTAEELQKLNEEAKQTIFE